MVEFLNRGFTVRAPRDLEGLKKRLRDEHEPTIRDLIRKTNELVDSVNGLVTDVAALIAATPTQASAISGITDSSGGSADGELSAVSGSGDDSTINDNFSEVSTKLDEILAALRSYGVIDT